MRSLSNQKDKNTFLDYFPPPVVLRTPPSGIDISDTTIKYIGLYIHRGETHIEKFFEKRISPGIVESGEIKKPKELAAALSEVKEKFDLRAAHASLPEERAYLFETEIAAKEDERIRDVIEFHLEENVPLSVEEVVFDYDIIETGKGDNIRVSVSVMPREVVEKYTEAFERAGVALESLEIEAQAVARAVVPRGDNRPHMVVDFGRTRTGIAIVTNGIVRFTSTVDMGGDNLTDVIEKSLNNLGRKEAERIKEERGVFGHEDPGLQSSLKEVVRRFAANIEKHVHFWGDHEGRGKEPIQEIVLCGGNATVPGVKEFLHSELSIPVVIPNVWQNAFNLDKKIPPIKYGDSLGYATALGLALKSEAYKYQ